VTGDAGARRFITRPTGKFSREDRAAIKHLWSLLYRAFRRDAQRVDRALRSIASVSRRLGAINVELTALRSRVERLERAYRRDGEPGDDVRRPT
jgi:hypothetical protein